MNKERLKHTYHLHAPPSLTGDASVLYFGCWLWPARTKRGTKVNQLGFENDCGDFKKDGENTREYQHLPFMGARKQSWNMEREGGNRTCDTTKLRAVNYICHHNLGIEGVGLAEVAIEGP